MINMNVPTSLLIHDITTQLQEKGFTNVKSIERWERDGVYEISCDQDPTQCFETEKQWYLTCIGTGDNHFQPGIDLVIINAGWDERFQVSSIDEIVKILSGKGYILNVK